MQVRRIFCVKLVGFCNRKRRRVEPAGHRLWHGAVVPGLPGHTGGVTSKYDRYWAASLGQIQAVLGGATIIMFGTVAVAGIRILATTTLDRRACTIAAVSFGLGLGVTFVPEISGTLPPLLKDMISSGIATGGLCALLLNSVLPR